MDYLPLLLQQEFNKYYTDVVNCDITYPSYYSGRVPHIFFLKKRGGFESHYNYGLTVEDFTVFNGVEYGLVKSGANLLVKQGATTLGTYTYNTNLNQKFKVVTSVNGTMSESGTGANGDDTTPGVFKLVDSTKTWTVNAYAGKYVYMYTGTVGAGQVGIIESNTTTELVLTNGWTVKPSNVSYKIFSSYGECLGFISGDGFYIIHNSTNIIKVDKFGIVKDLTVFKGKIFYVNSLDYVWYSEGGAYGNTYVNLTAPIGNIGNVLNIDTYQNYILMFKTDGVYLIDEKQITVSGTTMYDYKINLLTNLFGILNRGAYTIYNQGVHLITSVKKFIALSITPSGTDKYTIEETNEGIYIQRFLDNILSSDVLGIGIVQDKIVITHKSSSVTNIYTYDFFYKGWYRWVTELNISGVRAIGNFYYIGDKVYKTNSGTFDDEGDINYTQSVKVVVGEDNIFSIKKYNFMKFYMGSDTTSGTYVDYTCFLGGLKYIDKYEFKNSKWLTDKELVSGDGTMGSGVIGYSLLGGYSSLSAADIGYGDIGTIEIPLGFETELGIIEVVAEGTNRFSLGGLAMGYDLMEPQITALNNVLTSD